MASAISSQWCGWIFVLSKLVIVCTRILNSFVRYGAYSMSSSAESFGCSAEVRTSCRMPMVPPQYRMSSDGLEALIRSSLKGRCGQSFQCLAGWRGTHTLSARFLCDPYGKDCPHLPL